MKPVRRLVGALENPRAAALFPCHSIDLKARHLSLLPPEPERPSRKAEIRSGTFFLLANIGAGVLNYLFQVVAARQLTAQDFSQLNGWFADLSLFFMVGGILQYASNFRPTPRSQLRYILGMANGLTLVAIWLWLTQPGVLTFDRALLVLVTSTFFGWLMGQVQIRMQFVVISIANILVAGTKLGITGLPIGEPQDLMRYALGFFICYLPALWLISIYLWSAPEAERAEGNPSWTAPIMLSVATAVTPQFDLVLMNHTQDSLAFADFAHASLYYKAIYFLIFILAQWLLPRQIKKQVGHTLSDLPRLVAVAIVTSMALAVASPYISQWIMKWQYSPSQILVFLSCLHMSALAMLFLRIQEACAQKQVKTAAVILGVMGLEAALQLVLKLEMNQYLVTVIILQAGLLIWSRAPAARSS